MRRLALISLLSVAWQVACGQRASIAFWNVENLCDTLPSAFYDDREWTPQGARGWNTTRYRTKIKNLVRVIDAMAADVVGLAEVENEGVVRDLVVALATDYNYIHRSSGDRRGMDVTLLYKGDKFYPDANPAAPGEVAARLIRSGTGREFLHVSGTLAGEHIHLVVCHMASNLNDYRYRRRNMTALKGALAELLSDDPAAKIVVMGDMNATPDDRVVRGTIGSVAQPLDFVYAPHFGHHRAGQGTYNWRGRWYLYDWMLVSPSLARGANLPHTKGLKLSGAGIFAKEWMTQAAPPARNATSWSPDRPRRPLRTFRQGAYTGGFSDHFPVWITLGGETREGRFGNSSKN